MRPFVKENKYKYLLVIQFKYDNLPWEDVDEYDERESAECRRVLKEFRMDKSGSYRVVHRRKKRR